MKTNVNIILASLGIFLSASVTHAALITSFENSEGYVLGATTPPSGSGWVTYGTGVGGSISDNYAFTGAQSLRRPSGTASFSRRDFTLANNYQELTYSFFATGWDSFDLTSNFRIYLWNGTSDAASSISIASTYQNGSPNNQMLYQVGSGSSISVPISAATLDFNNWNTIGVSLNPATDKFSLSLNGTNFATDVTMPSDIVAIGRIYVYNSTNAGVDVYYDTITAAAVPEPAATGLVMLGLLLLLPAFRRMRQNSAA